mgnify:FL=1
MYNTNAEKKLVNRLFKNELIYSEIAGTGVDIPADLPELDVKVELNIQTDYILYVGRVDVFKITYEDFAWFLKYADESDQKI